MLENQVPNVLQEDNTELLVERLLAIKSNCFPREIHNKILVANSVNPLMGTGQIKLTNLKRQEIQLRLK